MVAKITFNENEIKFAVAIFQVPICACGSSIGQHRIVDHSRIHCRRIYWASWVCLLRSFPVAASSHVTGTATTLLATESWACHWG
jgi:hypothetical protein